MPCSDVLNKQSLGETRGDTLEHKDVVNSNHVDVVDPLFFELLEGAYVARDLGTASSCERARYANLQGVSHILLQKSRVTKCYTMTFLPLSSVMWKVCSGLSSLTAALVGNLLPGWISLLAMAAM